MTDENKKTKKPKVKKEKALTPTPTDESAVTSEVYSESNEIINVEATPTPSPIDKSGLIEKLKSAVLTIEFTKVDGSNRVMNATLNNQLIPKQGGEKLNSIKRVSDNPETVIVWDIDANGWRSFKFNSLKKINNKLV